LVQSIKVFERDKGIVMVNLVVLQLLELVEQFGLVHLDLLLLLDQFLNFVLNFLLLLKVFTAVINLSLIFKISNPPRLPDQLFVVLLGLLLLVPPDFILFILRDQPYPLENVGYIVNTPFLDLKDLHGVVEIDTLVY
jgi:hypothetical protein